MKGPNTETNGNSTSATDEHVNGRRVMMASEDSVVSGPEANSSAVSKSTKDGQSVDKNIKESQLAGNGTGNQLDTRPDQKDSGDNRIDKRCDYKDSALWDTIDSSPEYKDSAGSTRDEGPEFDNSYSGYKPPAGVTLEIDRIPANISPVDFFYRYIATRKPVVISGPLCDPQWKSQMWTNQYLKEKAGDAQVIVEKRGTNKESSFGLDAPKIHMSYGEFISNVMEGNDRLYMTTQDLERFDEDLDDHDMPRSVVAEPLKSLQDDFPTRPQLLSNLIPYQLSLWHGVAKNGTSSGLHHDYHDNLYVLLRGRKRFRLFAPSAAKHMRTAGILAKVHSNGLIVYRNKPDDPAVVVRSDGVPMSFLAREKKDDAESDLTSAEDALEKLGKSSLSEEVKMARRQELERRRNDAERRIDEAMEDILLYGCPGDVCSDSEDSDSENHHQMEPQSKRPRLDESDTSGDFTPKMPDHFCDMTFPTHTENPRAVFSAYPHLKEVGCINCDIRAGDMLYLPASWFHEVTSYSDPVAENRSPETPATCSEDIGHLAFNYWMFPPDNADIEQPYQHDFWPSRWDRIQRGPPLPIQKVWSSDDEEEEGEEEEEEEEEEQQPAAETR